MKKFILLISFLFGFNAQAGLITIDVSEDEVAVGESITVNLFASDFSPFDTFDFDFVYDNSLFSFETGSFTSDLTAVFPFLFETNENSNGLAISFTDFVSFTTSDFLLASFQLTATSAGISDFSLDLDVFGDQSTGFFEFDIFTSSNSRLAVDSSSIASATVQTSVPEPQAWMLLLTALVIVNRIKRTNLLVK